MASNKTHKENKEEIRKRVDNKDLMQYFSLDKSEIQDLSIAVRNNTFEEIAEVLQRNITSGGEGIEPLLNSSYDSEIEDLARKIIEEHVTELEVEAIESFRENDLFKIRELINEVENLRSFDEKRSDKILEQLKSAEKQISIPNKLEEKATELVLSKEKKVEDIRKVIIVNEWGRYKRKAIVVYGKKGILTWTYIDKLIRTKKPKLKYNPTKEEFKEKKITQIRSRKGENFSIKERLFIQSRVRKSRQKIYEEYIKSFGKIRPKSEIIDIINQEKS